MKITTASATALLLLTANHSSSFATDATLASALLGNSDFRNPPGLIAYDNLPSGLLVSLLIIGIYALYWFKQKA
ncbi:hypothetical protein NP590_05865 [Methylomonas sp. SURF-2]|uniref:Uncharacterized protein n=1 Tax=Methylomonas subterranea TaxID=2952225 RepID=A0ABT1TEW0_9GAMM|nr:hypothetical protein [Methylomonas sp. SURF-2]MCQ8103622.1 hypothetical protein [Methylomonas sp. SURF-2]